MTLTSLILEIQSMISSHLCFICPRWPDVMAFANRKYDV